MRSVVGRWPRAAVMLPGVAALALSGCAAAAPGSPARPAPPASGPLQQRLQVALDSLHAAGRFPGATVGVVLPDGTVLALSTGLADTTARTPMHPDARMHAGSVGKTYVSALVLQLVQEGPLGLDDPVAGYLGELPWYHRLPNAGEVTVRMLMNHTSGMVVEGGDPEFLPTLLRNPDRVWTVEERVRYMLDRPGRFPAGTRWAYSDHNYHLLGLVIEKATGADYEAELRRRLLEPLELHDTRAADRRVLPGLVQGYAGERDPVAGPTLREGQLVFNPQVEWTAGGIIATAADLARWARLLYEGRAFDPALLPELLHGVPAEGVPWPDTRYGLGVFLRPSPLGTTYGHSGYFPGYRADVMYFPRHRIAVALQLNTSAPDATPTPTSDFLVEVARIVLAEQAERRPHAAGVAAPPVHRACSGCRVA